MLYPFLLQEMRISMRLALDFSPHCRLVIGIYMKISLGSLLLAPLFFLSLSSFAKPEAPGAAKLGFVDYDRAIKEEKEAQKYFKDLEAEEVALAAWEQGVKAEFEKKMETYKASMEKLNEKQRKIEEEKLAGEVTRLQQESTTRRQKLQDNQQKRLEELKIKNNEVVEEIAKKHKLDVVFNAATLVWVAKNSPNIVDLTPDLIKQYNVKHTIKAPAAPAKGKVEKKPASKE